MPRPPGSVAQASVYIRPFEAKSSSLSVVSAWIRKRGASPSLNFSSAPGSRCPFIARIQPISEQTTVIGSRSTIASKATSSTSGASSKLVRRAPALRVLAEGLAHRAQLLGDPVPLQPLVGDQRREPGALGDQRVALGPDLHLLEPPQVAQPHVEDRLGLHVGQANSAIITAFGSSSCG